MKRYIAVAVIAIMVIAGGLIVFAGRGDETSDGDDKSAASTQSYANENVSNKSDELPPREESARYRITFQASWSSDSHPSTLPAGPHVSPMVVVTHSGAINVFGVGQAATEGIKQMAETGKTDILSEELEAKFASGVKAFQIGKRLDVPAVDSIEIEVTQDAYLLSMVSMLSPSPDWFVGVRDFPLFQEGAWILGLTLNANPYDAGTDSGSTFAADDRATEPQGVVSEPVDAIFQAAAAEGLFGTVLVEKI